MDHHIDEDCAAEGLYLVAVAPDARLQIQARIARSIANVARPLTDNTFWGAALMAEDDFWGVGNPWPELYATQWFTVASQMWGVIDGVQRTMRERAILAESVANEQRVISEVENAA